MDNRYRDEIRRIMIAINAIDGTYDLIAKKIGIKENTLALLYALDDGEPHSQKVVCEEWMIPKTTINTIVRECIDQGYVYLHANQRKKEKEICLTERGREYARRILEQVYELEEAAMEQTLAGSSTEFVGALEVFMTHLRLGARNFGK